ncbi:MAG: hypothetical protein IPM14_03790 [bacterium]|nr:hypothetical protein [bacterium]
MLIKPDINSIAKYGIILIGCLIFLSSLNNELYGQKKKKTEKKINKWSLSLSVRPYYDSNILKYSEKYIDRFKNREDEGRFHIETVDDLVWSYSIGVTFTDNIIGKLRTILGAGFDSDAYTLNSIKTWETYNIFLRQYFSASTSFSASYSYIPGFYVRHFRDEDWVFYYGFVPETFRPYIFSKDDFSFWLQHIFDWKTTRARIYFAYDRYYLDESNTEYDSHDYIYGFRIYQSLFNNVDLNFGYLYSTSDAKGYDEPGETKEDSDDSDATNFEHAYYAGIGYALPKIFSRNNDISVDVQYLRAFYTTDHFLELDPLHAGRYDYNYRVFVNYNIDVIENLTATAFYHWFKRESSSAAEENKEYVSDEKDYTQYRVGINFNYVLNF